MVSGSELCSASASLSSPSLLLISSSSLPCPSSAASLTGQSSLAWLVLLQYMQISRTFAFFLQALTQISDSYCSPDCVMTGTLCVQPCIAYDQDVRVYMCTCECACNHAFACHYLQTCACFKMLSRHSKCLECSDCNMQRDLCAK